MPWVYNKVDALVWDAAVTNSSGGGSYVNDWFNVAASKDYGQMHVIQPGCTTPNGAFTKRDVYSSTATQLEIGYQLAGGPSAAAVVLLLGTQLSSTPVPGLCAPLGLTPVATIGVGSTDGAGNLTVPTFNVPWNASFSGALLAAQAAAADASQPGFPVALSQATYSSLPKTAGTPGVNCLRTFSSSSATAATGSAPTQTGMPTEYSN